MRFEAEVHGTVKGTELTYVLVRYFASDSDTEPTLVEEHLMQLADEGERIITDANGHYQLADGSFIDPAKMEPDGKYEFARETFKRDVMAEIAEAAGRRWQRGIEKKQSGDWTGDDTKPAYVDGVSVKQGRQIIETDDADPKGVLARADIEAIKKPRVVAAEPIKGGAR